MGELCRKSRMSLGGDWLQEYFSLSIAFYFLRCNDGQKFVQKYFLDASV